MGKTNFEKLQGYIPALDEFEASLDKSEVTPEQLQEFIREVAQFIEKLVEIGVIDKTFTKNPFYETRYVSYFIVVPFIEGKILKVFARLKRILFKMKYNKVFSGNLTFINGVYDLLKEESVYNMDFANFINPQEA